MVLLVLLIAASVIIVDADRGRKITAVEEQTV